MAQEHSRRWAKEMPLWLLKLFLRVYPPILGAGFRLKKFAADNKTVEVVLKLRWYNKNLVGTHFGGSLFMATDPFYMMMLIRLLGDDYLVWDKAASIDFKKPGRGAVHATFVWTDEEVESIKRELQTKDKLILNKSVDIIDDSGAAIASVVRTIYIARKNRRQNA